MLFRSMSAQLISESFWNSLSAEDQEIFERLIDEAEAEGYKRVEELNDYYREECLKSGMQIRELSQEEIQVFKDLMEEKVYPLAVETMGQERWDALQGYLEN